MRIRLSTAAAAQSLRDVWVDEPLGACCVGTHSGGTSLAPIHQDCWFGDGTWQVTRQTAASRRGNTRGRTVNECAYPPADGHCGHRTRCYPSRPPARCSRSAASALARPSLASAPSRRCSRSARPWAPARFCRSSRAGQCSRTNRSAPCLPRGARGRSVRGGHRPRSRPWGWRRTRATCVSVTRAGADCAEFWPRSGASDVDSGVQRLRPSCSRDQSATGDARRNRSRSGRSRSPARCCAAVRRRGAKSRNSLRATWRRQGVSVVVLAQNALLGEPAVEDVRLDLGRACSPRVLQGGIAVDVSQLGGAIQSNPAQQLRRHVWRGWPRASQMPWSSWHHTAAAHTACFWTIGHNRLAAARFVGSPRHRRAADGRLPLPQRRVRRRRWLPSHRGGRR